MKSDRILVLLCTVACLLAARPLSTLAIHVCWSSEEVCVINAKLQHGPHSNQADLPIEIDCLNSTLDDASEFELVQSGVQDAFLLRRYEHVEKVTLDGCDALLNAPTYGFELLPNCGNIRHTIVERFHGDTMQQFHCSSQIQMEILMFRNNEITTVAANSFANLSLLHEIYFSQNCLRHVNNTAFEGLTEIELIHFEQEECLNIKEDDLFERTSVADLRLIALKHLPPNIGQHLPESLRFILISDVPIDGGTFLLTNPQSLRNVSIINCALNSFTLSDPYSSVTCLNLSRNAITHFQLTANVLQSALRSLDLSENGLTYLRTEWMRNLSCLEMLLLHGNHLKKISLHGLLSTVPKAHYIDLRENELVALGDTEGELQVDCDRTRILVDRNHWNCMWLLNFTNTHPEKFRILQYQKFVSKINVNGLECQAVDSLEKLKQNTFVPQEVEHSSANKTAPINVSTFTLVYDKGRDSKRNQRAEALIIVFMLPLGIAVLFLLLYMWIYCQKMFHWSYYRSIPCIGNSATPRAVDRFDVVRQMPTKGNAANLNGDYEIPLNGVASACNCNHIGEKNEGVNQGQCKKRHHITYEAPPNEPLFKMYEEILEDDHYTEMDYTEMQQGAHPFYDHLTFVDASQIHAIN